MYEIQEQITVYLCVLMKKQYANYNVEVDRSYQKYSGLDWVKNYRRKITCFDNNNFIFNQMNLYRLVESGHVNYFYLYFFNNNRIFWA